MTSATQMFIRIFITLELPSDQWRAKCVCVCMHGRGVNEESHLSVENHCDVVVKAPFQFLFFLFFLFSMPQLI